MKHNSIKVITLGGILTSFVVLSQLAPVFLPVGGMIFSPFSTFPIVIATIINTTLGFLVLCSSVFLLLFISIEEAFILLFCTGLFGFVLGFLFNRKGWKTTLISSSIALSLGMLTLTYFIGIDGFQLIISYHLLMHSSFIFSFRLVILPFGIFL